MRDAAPRASRQINARTHSGRQNQGSGLRGTTSELLSLSKPYVDLGSRYLEERDKQNIQRRLVRGLEAYGYSVKLEAAT